MEPEKSCKMVDFFQLFLKTGIKFKKEDGVSLECRLFVTLDSTLKEKKTSALRDYILPLTGFRDKDEKTAPIMRLKTVDT